MVQARGIQIRENVRYMGAQVIEQMVRGAYNINGTGTKQTHILTVVMKNREQTTKLPSYRTSHQHQWHIPRK